MADENTLRIEFEDTGGAAGTTPAAPGVSPDVRALLDQLRKGQTEGVGGITAQQARYASIAFQAGGLQTPDVLERFLNELKPIVDKGQQAFALIQSYSPGGKNYTPPTQTGRLPGTPPLSPPPPPPAGGPAPEPPPDDGRRGPQIPADVQHAAYIRASLARQREGERQQRQREQNELDADLRRQFVNQRRGVEAERAAGQRQADDDARRFKDEQQSRLARSRTLAGAAQTAAGGGLGNLVSAGLQAATTGAFGETAAALAGGPAGVAIAAAGAVFSQAVGKFREAVSEFNARARQLAAYSGPLASAVAQQDVSRLQADIREANRTGPDLARLIRSQTDIEQAILSAILPIQQAALKALADTTQRVSDNAKELRQINEQLGPALQLLSAVLSKLAMLPARVLSDFFEIGVKVFKIIAATFGIAQKQGDKDNGNKLLQEVLDAAKAPLARPPDAAAQNRQQQNQVLNLPAFLNPFGLPPLGNR